MVSDSIPLSNSSICTLHVNAQFLSIPFHLNLNLNVHLNSSSRANPRGRHCRRRHWRPRHPCPPCLRHLLRPHSSQAEARPRHPTARTSNPAPTVPGSQLQARAQSKSTSIHINSAGGSHAVEYRHVIYSLSCSGAGILRCASCSFGWRFGSGSRSSSGTDISTTATTVRAHGTGGYLLATSATASASTSGPASARKHAIRRPSSQRRERWSGSFRERARFHLHCPVAATAVSRGYEEWWCSGCWFGFASTMATTGGAGRDEEWCSGRGSLG